MNATQASTEETSGGNYRRASVTLIPLRKPSVRLTAEQVNAMTARELEAAFRLTPYRSVALDMEDHEETTDVMDRAVIADRCEDRS